MLRNERGAEAVQWVALSGVVVIMIVAIWAAFYGGAGQMLRRTIQAQTTRYALSFEGGVQTNGPRGRLPRFVGDVFVEPVHVAPIRLNPAILTPLMIDPIPITAQDVSILPISPDEVAAIPLTPGEVAAIPLTPDEVASIPLTPGEVAAIPLTPGEVAAIPLTPDEVASVPVSPLVATGASMELPMVLIVHIRPTPGVRTQIDAETGRIVLSHPRWSYLIVIDPKSGKAFMVDPATRIATPVDLETMQRMGWIQVRYEQALGHAAPIYLPVLAIPVLAIPSLTIPVVSLPFLSK